MRINTEIEQVEEVKGQGSFRPQEARGNNKEVKEEEKNSYTKHCGTDDRRY